MCSASHLNTQPSPLQSTLLATIHCPAAICDGEGKVLAANHEALLRGWSDPSFAWHRVADKQVPIEGGFLLVATEPLSEMQLMRDIVLHSSEGVIVCDYAPGGTPRFPIVFANEAMSRISGYTIRELIGQSPSLLQGPAPVDGFRQRIGQAIASGTAVTVEGVNYRKSGRPYDCRISIFPIRHQGTITHWVGMHSDISEQRRIEEQFHHSQRLEGLGLLAGGVAHDFNNILTCILGYTMLAQVDVSASSPVHERLRQVVAACSRAQELVRALLAYSAKSETKMQQTNLGDFTAETLVLMKGMLAKKAKVTTDIVQTGTSLEADGSQLRQVVMNLLMNAADAMVPGRSGEIRVTVRPVSLDQPIDGCRVSSVIPSGRWIELCVRDDGCGMADHVLQNIFTPLYTTKPNGHGLGLSAVLGIMKRHCGHLLCSSSEGRGTEFRLFFRPVEEQVSAAPWPVRFTGGGSILVMDDEPCAISAAAEILHRLGFVTLSANNGEVGLSVFREHKSTLRAAFIDFSMPVKAGIETLREIREESDIPVIITTGFTADAIAPHIASLPAHVRKNVTCMEKPAGADDVRAALSAALK